MAVSIGLKNGQKSGNLHTADYGLGADMVADILHSEAEKKFVFEMDMTLKKIDYFAQALDWNEGPTYAYYGKERELKSKGPYHFLMVSWKTKLLLFLRIRNATKCLDYLKTCPDTVKQVFLWSDSGCNKRIERCGCCNAPFYFSPRIEDISYYPEMVKIGLKK